MSLMDTLHDEIDVIEWHQDQAAKTAEGARETLRAALIDGMDPAEMFKLAAVEVAVGITDITTAAFKAGAAFDRKRRTR